MKTPSYRRDIDGLRSVAILPVIVFHAASNILPGGYLGVDIFFVISGYLIAGLIFSALDEDRFSFAQFYFRRAKRLMPAYIVMIAAVLAAGYFILLPREFIPLAKTALASVFSASNFQLATAGDYFAPDTASNPLMHTWSLAIEEQFYLVFPLFAWALFRRSRWNFAWALGGLLVVSLAVVVYHASQGSPWAHYSPLARAWQLTAGCLLALLHNHTRAQFSRPVAETASIAAIFIILVLFVISPLFGEVQNALMTCIATLVLIHTGRATGGTLVSRLLSLSPFVGIGLISYSAYLWHQPLIAYTKLFTISDHAGYLPAITLLSLAVGWVSWKLVETPGRHATLPAHRLVPRFATALFVLAIASGFVIKGHGLSGRFHEGAFVSKRDFEEQIESARCGFWKQKDVTSSDLCYIDATLPIDESIGTIAIWGDSHAASLASGFRATSHDFPFVQMAFHGCYVGMFDNRKDKVRGCEEKRIASMNYLRTHEDVQTVVVHARWQFSLNQGNRGANLMQDSIDAIREIHEMGKRIIVVRSVPVHTREVLPMHNRMRYLGLDPVQRLPLEAYRERQRAEPGIFWSLMKDLQIEVVDIEDLFCSEKTASCASHDLAGQPLYEDEGHLLPLGAQRIADHLIANYIQPSIAH